MNEIDLIKYLEHKDLNKPEDLLVETLEGFGTWDSIHFHGGMSLNGDIMTIGLDLDDWMEEIDDLKTLNISHRNKFYHLITGVNSTLRSSRRNTAIEPRIYWPAFNLHACCRGKVSQGKLICLIFSKSNYQTSETMGRESR